MSSDQNKTNRLSGSTVRRASFPGACSDTLVLVALDCFSFNLGTSKFHFIEFVQRIVIFGGFFLCVYFDVYILTAVCTLPTVVDHSPKKSISQNQNYV